MFQGDPNQKRQAFAPPDLAKSRRLRPPGTANPMGLGTEWLMGAVAQPVSKINSLPGFGQTNVDPALLADILRRRTAGLPPPGRLLRF